MDGTSMGDDAPVASATGRSGRGRNVGSLERVTSVVGGGLLAAYGLRRGGAAGGALALAGAALVGRGATGRCALYHALGINTDRESGPDWLVQQHGPEAVLDASTAERVERSITINRPREELYAFWRDFENLPRVMRNVTSVEVLDRRRTRWRARGPAGSELKWEARLYNDIPGELIAWKTLLGADVPNAGSVRFADAPDGRGTTLYVTLEYAPPTGALGAAVARIFGEDPGEQIAEDLQRFKQHMERAATRAD